MKLRPGQEKSEHALSRTHALKITELKNVTATSSSSQAGSIAIIGQR